MTEGLRGGTLIGEVVGAKNPGAHGAKSLSQYLFFTIFFFLNVKIIIHVTTSPCHNGALNKLIMN